MSKNDLNFATLRKKFPIFSQKVNEHALIYFDSASTAQVPQKVVDTMMDYYATYKANVGRGIYSFAEQATEKYEQARAQVAKFIGADKNQIIFTSGATESINLVAQGWAEHALKAGDEIIISSIEHHSNFLPWQQLALQKKLTLRMVPVSKQGIVEIAEFKKYLSSKTKLVAMVHTSNVTGGTNDVVAMTKLAHQVGAKVLIDGAQSVVHQSIDVKKIKCDFLAFSGHKLFGPTGVGVLYVADSVAEQMQLQKFGGGMVFSVAEQKSEFKKIPYCFEAGTPNIAGVIGLGAAIEFVQENIDFESLSEHETDLVRSLAHGLAQFKDIKILSFMPKTLNDHAALLTFYSTKHHAHDIAAFLDSYGIAVRAGHHCVQLFHQSSGINASVRVSFSVYNTKEEVEFFLEVLQKLLV